MRPFLVAPSTFALATALLSALPTACGGAEPQEALEAPSGGTTGGSSSSGATGDAGGATSSGGTSSGGVADASVTEASTACPSEVEPNDSKDQANVLSPSRCGAIQPNSESDFLTFQLAPKSTSLDIKFSGQVTLKIEVDGQSVTLGGGKFPPVPFVKGKRYFIEIKATDRGTSIPWRVDLLEK